MDNQVALADQGDGVREHEGIGSPSHAARDSVCDARPSTRAAVLATLIGVGATRHQ
jgi:hypothetical protein